MVSDIFQSAFFGSKYICTNNYKHRYTFLKVTQSGTKLDDFFEVSDFFPHIFKDVEVCLCPLVPDYITLKERIKCTILQNIYKDFKKI